MKLTKPEQRILEQGLALLRDGAYYSPFGDKLNLNFLTESFPVYKAAEIKAAQRLEARGIGYTFFMKDAQTTYYHMDNSALKFLETSPKKIVIEALEAKLASITMIDEKPNVSEWSVKSYRDLYSDPEMTVGQVERLEVDRIRQNRRSFYAQWGEVAYALDHCRKNAPEFPGE